MLNYIDAIKRFLRMDDQKFKILKYRSYGQGLLMGFFDLEVIKWGATVHGLKHFKKGSSEWISMPSQEVEENGEKKYYPIVRFLSPKHTEYFNLEVMDLVNEYLKNLSKPNLSEHNKS